MIVSPARSRRFLMNDSEPLGPRLEFTDGGKTGRIVSIEGNGIQIGRDPFAGVRYEDACISRKHARIERHADGAFYLVDTSKHQATFLNGRRMLETRPVRLADGDRIRVADHELIFRCESRVLPVETEAGSTVLETLSDLTSDHLAVRARRPAETLKAVLNVNRSLGGGGDLDQVMGRALSSLMELFPNTECGVIVTVERGGDLPVQAIQHRDGPPPKLTLSRTILNQVVERGEAALIRDVATDERYSKHESVAALFRSALCVPLPGSDGHPVGMVQLGVRDDRRSRFTGEDLELLAALALPIAAAVENDRLLRERAHWAAAREIQRALLPRERPEIAGYSFWECYRPALEVGGDSYDYIPVAGEHAGRDSEPRWVVCVGDVSGKGMPAALLSAAVRPEIRNVVRGGDSPAKVLARVNRHVCEGGIDTRFVTMLVAELDPSRHELTLANAGHERPLIRRADGTVERIELPGTGLALGIRTDEAYSATSLRLELGEVLVLHSDGLFDAHDRQGSRFGAERAMQTLSRAPAAASLAGEALLEAVTLHSEGAAPFDDLTIVCIGRDAT
jgi:serine phosphatase RsbU (regulator of sigma subunit)/pSer/pThr/pTyr-binding forkhead associated (FHA) protein